jgi:hypothetical protein
MANEKKNTVKQMRNPLFDRNNYIWMGVGALMIALGFFLMVGGKSADPNQFNDSEIYSTTRITIAPLLIIAGFLVEVFAIMKKPASEG